MNFNFLQSLITLGRLPNTNCAEWLEDARSGVDLLKRWIDNGCVVLYAGCVPHIFVRSILVPRTAITPADHDDLAKIHIPSGDSWSIEHIYGGGKGRRIRLEPPLSNPGCKTLMGGEHTVFLRQFEDEMSIEINQKLLQSLNLHYMDDRNGYCKLNDHGDIRRVISLYDDGQSDLRLRAVTMCWDDLETYMAVADMALVMEFDFLRCELGNFPGWQSQDVQEFRSSQVFYRWCVISGRCSYATGHIVFQAARTTEDLIKEWEIEEDVNKRQYASFKILDRKNSRLIETNCGPEHIVNYFTDSDLPWEISPAFFRADVLYKFKANPEKYSISQGGITCRNAWRLRSFYVNDAGQVHAWIGDLARLPYEEQLYWKSFNEWPDGPIAQSAYENAILGQPASRIDPITVLKELIVYLNRRPPTWWTPRDKRLVATLHGPATDAPKEWGDEIQILDQLVIEGFASKGLRSLIPADSDLVKPKMKSLKLLESVLTLSGFIKEDAKRLVAPLKQVHNIRNMKSHSNTDFDKEVANARKQHDNLSKHFWALAISVSDSMRQIVECLPGGLIDPTDVSVRESI